MNEQLTVKETATILRVSPRTVFNYIKQGILSPIKIGGIKKTGKNLIPRIQIENLLKSKVV